ncbi:MAG: malto-oligosyltrehalose trehalohydrolase [Proteobacteria bacterium]|nr:malto-oligosyltrehalose trehalohydrolase [Pseudomonadota bacterium]
MPFGAELVDDGGTRFRLWAPDAAHVGLRIEVGPAAGTHPMDRLVDGWHELTLAQAGAGTRYRYVLPDGLVVPDPASRWNPDDVAGPSVVVDPASYAWRDTGWRGRPWREAVVYELHVGCYTPDGTFEAAAARLAELAALGITAIELMPVADFPGRRGWGYDGVLLFAPDAAYGPPDALKAFVDRAHELGLMVLLDVVYNHFGPEGNYLHAYASPFFNARHRTPWGAAINFDAAGSATVRDFYLHNALMWLHEYHFDGLRLDAVHAIRDSSATDIVGAIALAAAPLRRERHVHLVLENHANEADRLAATPEPQGRHVDAQWNDDFHHAAHVILTGERDGYYVDYAERPVEQLGRALAEGYVYQGEPSPFMDGRPRGQPSARLPSTAFVAFLQNHDQIGNRAFGDRLAASAVPQRIEAMLACLLLGPQIPMLFMGEEYAATTPFLYFCDFHGELADAVRNGRRREFARSAAFADAASQIPDPNAASTFDAGKLNEAERTQPAQAARLALVRRLLALRRTHLWPLLPLAAGRSTSTRHVLAVDWSIDGRPVWHLRANFGSLPQPFARPPGATTVHAALAIENRSELTLEPDGVWIAAGMERPQ